MHVIRLASRVCYAACNFLLVTTLGIMSIAVFIQVILRYVFSTTWLQMEDTVIYSFSISIFAGTAMLFRTGDHIAITFIAEALRPLPRKVVRLFADLISLGFLVFLLVVGVQFMRNGMHQFSPLLKFPLGYIYAIVPFTALAGILFVLDRNLTTWNRAPTRTSSEDSTGASL